MFEIIDEDTLSDAQKTRLKKHGWTLSQFNIDQLCQQIDDYPEIIAAVQTRPTRPEFDPDLGGD